MKVMLRTRLGWGGCLLSLSLAISVMPAWALDAEDAQVERGRYLARAADCQACHTQRGGPPYAGGRAMPSPFGTFYTPNLTPDAETGLGRWNAEDFARALRHGRAPDGSAYYPAFPYTSYTRMRREDIDAIYAYLRTLVPVAAPNRPYELRFPYSLRALLPVWQWWYLTPGERPSSQADAELARGEYLVEALGHCEGCHQRRDTWGLGLADASGAGARLLGWYAPSLRAPDGAGVQDWPLDEIVALLGGGRSRHAVALGPMAEIVFESLQYLNDADIQAMARYLKAMPTAPAEADTVRVRLADAAQSRLREEGREIYASHCADCHGAEGEGDAHALALAGNRSVLQEDPSSLIRVLLYGGFGPSTARQPQPYGMPPFAQVLNQREQAAVLTFLRQSWGNEASAVAPLEIEKLGGGGPLW